MAKKMKFKGAVEYRKEIKTKKPEAFVEIKLSFEGLMEGRLPELREMFNKFCAEVEGIVMEDTTLYI